MKFTRIIHEGQMEIFPHITISMGYVDEYGNDCDDAVLIFIGWFVFDLCFFFPRNTKTSSTKEEFIKDMNQI